MSRMQFLSLQRTMAVNCWLLINSFVLLAFVLLATTLVANATPAPSLTPGTLKEVLKNFKNGNNNNKASRSLRVPMDEDVSMDLYEFSIQSQRAQALKMCRSPQVRRDSDLSTQWWNDDLSKSLTCQMGRHVTKMHVPDVQRANSSHRISVLRSLNWAAGGAATVAKKLGNSVAEGMGYKDFDHWAGDWGQVRLPCLPPPDSEEFVNNRSKLSALKSLATFWHGNLQSYFIFFAMAGNTKDVTGRFTDGAREYSCRLHEVLSYVRNLLVQLNMRPAFKVVTPPALQCMEKKCSYAVDHFQRLAIGVRDSLALLVDIQRHVDAFRRYDDDDT